MHRYYAKMNTEVDADPARDSANLEAAYSSTDYAKDRKLFPNSDLEFVKPTAKDIIGFTLSVLACFVVLGLLIWIAGIGR